MTKFKSKKAIYTEGGIDEKTPTHLTITDLYGRLIFQKNGLMLADVPFDIALEKDAIAAGIYIVSCQNGATYLVQKVVIQ